jgi:hypothetical protein
MGVSHGWIAGDNYCGHHSHRNETSVGEQGRTFRPSKEEEKNRPCHAFKHGKCVRTKLQCRFSHDIKVPKAKGGGVVTKHSGKGLQPGPGQQPRTKEEKSQTGTGAYIQVQSLQGKLYKLYVGGNDDGTNHGGSGLPPQGDGGGGGGAVGNKRLKGDNKQKNKACFNLKKEGHCSHGDACRFSHDVDHLAATTGALDNVEGAAETQICYERDIQKGSRSLRPCYDNQKGSCKRKGCKFSHE